MGPEHSYQLYHDANGTHTPIYDPVSHVDLGMHYVRVGLLYT